MDEVSSLKVVDLAGNHIGTKDEDMGPIHTLLTTSAGSLTALDLSGCVKSPSYIFRTL